MRRVGVMGGTFDPVHHGHLVAASEAAHRCNLDEVLFVPAGQPWQKSDRVVTAAEDRYLMTVIATTDDPRFSVSRVDIDRPGPTYTVDTLRDLTSYYAAAGIEASLFFITGADALAEIASWYESADLLALAHFIAVTRPGHVLVDPGFSAESVTFIEIPALDVSSTDCRARVAEGAPIRYLVPEGVREYIAKRNLYVRAES
ncbi:MAG: nicotinate-nucleotide adenylyltransferase [Actinomycetes bacterium]